VVGSVVGGALADRLGRKGMFLFGLVASALSSLFMGTVDSLALFFVGALLTGLLAESAGPARQAMVADLLPEEQRAQGFGIVRVVVNLAVTIGPMIGGLLAAQSYLLLFVSDAVTSLITAVVVYLALQETRPTPAEGEAAPGVAQTFGGYLDVLRDAAFAWFLAASMLAVLVYMQMNTTLAVYLRDIHGVAEQGYGYILSLNAAMVVLFQFPITRWLGRFRPLAVMVVGTLCYAVGFALYGFVSAYWLFLVAMVIITIGEMFTSPTAQAIVARLAPGDMRGRYMAVYGFAWVVPMALGPLMAGLVMDNVDPRWVWYGAGLVGLVASGAYYLLQWQVRRAGLAAVDRRLEIVARLEEDELTAEQAAELLREVGDGKLATLGPAPAEGEDRRVRVRITDLATGAMKADLCLPLGLVNTILYTGGRLAAGLEEIDARALREMVARSAAGEGAQILEGDGPDQIEVSVE
jgi:MFS family permease